MHHDIEIGYLGIEVPEPDSLSGFFGEVIGLVPGESPEGGTLTWRNDDRAHRVIVRPGPADDAVFIGFEAVDEEAFERVAARLAATGAELTEGTEDERAARRVGRLVSTEAPWGGQVELVHGLEQAASPFESARMGGGFLTDGVGFGHVVLATTNHEAAHRFAVDGLGMAQSDWIELEIAEGIELEVRFYHCNARHHTLALARAPFDLPQKLHHLMVETRLPLDVGLAFDRAWKSGLPIPMGIGLHDNDRMFSFYVASPAGFLVEVGNGARTITEPWEDNRQYTATSVWGHQPIRLGS